MLLASARLRRAVLPTLGWGKQSTWLAASGSLAHLRAWPEPTLRGAAGVLKHEAGRQERTAVAAVWALCAGFGADGGGCPCRGYLDSVGPCAGRWLSWTSHDAVILTIQNIQFQQKNASGKPCLGPLGAFDFRTRIKGGGRKRPPPGHKAPQCGAFPGFSPGGRNRGRWQFWVVGFR